MANKTEENPEEILPRMNNFINLLKNINGDVICISHAFIMKFYEILFRNNGVIKDVKVFAGEYDWSIKPYEFLDGFCVFIDDNNKIKSVELLRDVLK